VTEAFLRYLPGAEENATAYATPSGFSSGVSTVHAGSISTESVLSITALNVGSLAS
jgi:hypothetical protein